MVVNEEDLAAAFADLALQSKPNYKATAKKYNLQRTTLMRRHKNKTVSRSEATSLYRRKLTDGQEEAIIYEIHRLNEGFPPRPLAIKKLVAKFTNQPVGGC